MGLGCIRGVPPYPRGSKFSYMTSAGRKVHPCQYFRAKVSDTMAFVEVLASMDGAKLVDHFVFLLFGL